jgi:hypothetical protein
LSAYAQVPLTSVGTDPYSGDGLQHATTVEPDTFSFGTTIVTAYQSGRGFEGGASNIKFARSGNSGATWVNGNLPGITKIEGGIYDRASDPSVAFDARHNVWLVSTLGLKGTTSFDEDVVVSRSIDGGISWGAPILVSSEGEPDKNWIVCDNTSTSPFFGRCYHQWDDTSLNGRMRFSFSTDGGLTWSAARSTADLAMGLAGQPLVQPNGTVIVPFTNGGETQIRVVRSLNGGETFRNSFSVASIIDRTVRGGLRTSPLPSAEIDGAGRIFVSWQDCRFQPSCNRNDIVFITSNDGLSWSSVRRVPIHSIGTTFDHFIPGLGVNKATSGSTARLGLAYYFYPQGNCGFSTCQLGVGFISSQNGGVSWSAPRTLASSMNLSWLANTSQGRMVGDYISTSWSGGTAHPVFAIASAPIGDIFNERMVTPTTGLALDESAEEFFSEEYPEPGVQGIDSEEEVTPMQVHRSEVIRIR